MIIFCNIEIASGVQFPPLHLEAVRIGVIDALVVEIMSLEADYYFITVEIDLWQAVQVNVELDDSQICIQLNVDDGIHVWLASPLVQLAVVQDDLRHHVTLRDRGILQLAVCKRIKEIINWSEYIRPRMLVSIVDIRWPIFQTKIKKLTGVGL